MKIGVISDTHRKTRYAKEAIAMLCDAGAEFFIHAGDICERAVLEYLSESGKRYVAVYGNNDAGIVQYHHIYNLVQEPHYFKLADRKFKLMHLPFYMSPDADIVIYGHTHKFACEMQGDTLFLNPGEVCAREKPLIDAVVLHVNDDAYVVEHLFKKPDTDTWQSEIYNYSRL